MDLAVLATSSVLLIGCVNLGIGCSSPNSWALQEEMPVRCGLWLHMMRKRVLWSDLHHEEDVYAKAVTVGAANSEALYEVVKHGAAQPTCAYCGHAVPANWLHVAWACVAWLDGRPRPKKAPARKRLGWPAPRDTKERGRSVLR